VEILDALISLGSFIAVVYLIQYAPSWHLLTGKMHRWANFALRLAAATTAAGYFWKALSPGQISWATVLVDAGVLAAMIVFYQHIRKKEYEKYKKTLQHLANKKTRPIFADRRS